MDERTRSVIQSTFDASNMGHMHFGEVIERLMSVQVEAYQVDYRSSRRLHR